MTFLGQTFRKRHSCFSFVLFNHHGWHLLFLLAGIASCFFCWGKSPIGGINNNQKPCSPKKKTFVVATGCVFAPGSFRCCQLGSSWPHKTWRRNAIREEVVTTGRWGCLGGAKVLVHVGKAFFVAAISSDEVCSYSFDTS